MRLFPALLLLVFLQACGPVADPNKGEVVAKVQRNYLYESDLMGVVSPGTGKQDSIQLVNSFVDNWVRKQLLIRQAEKNLTSEQTDFKKKLEDYRNSLIIYTYETELIKQKLDTAVSEEEISAYYEANRKNFELRYNIVKVAYVVLPFDFKKKDLFRKLMRNPDTLLVDSLDARAGRFALNYFNDTESWIRFDDLVANIPIETYNQEVFLRNNRFIEIDDEPFTYMVRFIDFRIKESESPIEIEHDNIKNIILNKRKQELLRKMHDNLYEKAVRDNAFEIYSPSAS